MIGKINTNLIQDIQPNKPGKKGDASKLSPPSPDAAIQVAYGDLISGAMDNAEIAQIAMERAQSLIASGEIDSAESVRGAAKNMLTFGI